MIIEIESIHSDNLIFGKHIEYNVLKSIVKELLNIMDEKSFVSNFCSRYGYELIPYDENVKIDYIIDLDTHMVIKPQY